MVILVQQESLFNNLGIKAYIKTLMIHFMRQSSYSFDTLTIDSDSENDVTEEKEEEEYSVVEVAASSVCSWKAVTSTISR